MRNFSPFCSTMLHMDLDTWGLGLTEVTPLMNQGFLIHFFEIYRAAEI